jgi:hypothetical protein
MATITIIIPIFEETAALAFSKFYFDRLGLHPIYALDSKRIARRDEVEKLLNCQVKIYQNSGQCIEASYDKLAALSPTDWILRIDCDEVPNTEMLRQCARFIAHPLDAYCGFDRDDLIWRQDHFERLQYAPLFVDNQFRLFNRRKVKFIGKIHTPGFYVPKWKVPFIPIWNAPLKARIYHLQRVFILAQQRVEKVARYNGAGQAAGFNDWLSRPDDSFKWKPLHDKEFTQSFAAWKNISEP